MSGKKLVLVYHTFSSKTEQNNKKGYFKSRASVPIDRLESQLEWLSQFADFVPLNQITQVRQKQNWEVAVTLDDGYKNNFSLALPVFEKYEVPVTCFVSTKFVETDDLPWWDLVDYAARVTQPQVNLNIDNRKYSFDLTNAVERQDFYSWTQKCFKHASGDFSSRVRAQLESCIPGLLPRNAFAERSEIVEASSSPFVSIGAHTVTHPNLTNLPLEEARYEIKRGKEKLEGWTGQPVKWFAFPYGGREHWSQSTKKLVDEIGFDGAVTTMRGYADDAVDKYQIPRLTMLGTRAFWKTKAWIRAMNMSRNIYYIKQWFNRY